MGRREQTTRNQLKQDAVIGRCDCILQGHKVAHGWLDIVLMSENLRCEQDIGCVKLHVTAGVCAAKPAPYK